MFGLKNKGDSPRALNVAYWIATHRQLLHKIYISCLIVFAAAMWIFFIIFTLNWFLHIKSTEKILRELASPNLNFTAGQSRPYPLKVNYVKALAYDESIIDVLAEVTNPNEKWAIISADYNLQLNGEVVVANSVSFAPLETKYLVNRQIKGSLAYSSAQIIFSNYQWKKIIASKLPKTDWGFENINFRPLASDVISSESPFKSEFSFDVRNKSVYGFRSPEIVAIIRDSSGQILAVANVVVDVISSLESRTFTFRWPASLSASSQAQIKVNTNLLNEDLIIRRW